MKSILLLLLLFPVDLVAQVRVKKVLVEGEGQPIVLLNGGTADMSVFTTHSAKLSAHYKVIRMEQFNVQYAAEGSVLPENYSVRMESEAIKRTLDSLKITEPIILAGHSYGGLIALDFALHHARSIKALVLVEPPVFGIAEGKNEDPEGLQKMQELTRELGPQTEITEETVKRFRCELMNCDTFDIRQHPLWTKWLAQKNRLRGLSAVNQYRLNVKKLRRFKKPVLILTGTETVPFHQRINALLASEFRHVTMDKLTGGHIAINSNPDEFIECLRKFLH